MSKSERLLAVRNVWATADEHGRYLNIYSSEESATRHLEEDKAEGAVSVIQGYAVFDVEKNLVCDDADDFHYSLDDAELELGLLISNDLGIAAEEGTVGNLYTDSDIEDVSDDGRDPDIME